MMNKDVIGFFVNEYHEEKKKERALLKLDLSEVIFRSYTAAQPTERGKSNPAFRELNKWWEELRHDIIDNYDEFKREQQRIEGRNTWAELEKTKKVKF